MANRDNHHGNLARSNKKKGPTKGSGGKGRRSLRGRGATPKAENRPYHAAYQARIERETKEKREHQAARAREKSSAIHVRRGHELIAGRNPVMEAANSGMPISRIYLAGNLASDKRLARVIEIATAQGAPVVEVPRPDLDYATEGAVHQGVAAEVAEYAYADLEDLFAHASRVGHQPLIVMLDGVTDPHNLGAIVRSAAAFGTDGVVIPNRRSASMNVTAWKASAGAAARIPVARVSNIVQSIRTCQERGCFSIGLDGHGTTTITKSGLADGPLVIVTGAEGAGLSRLARDTCDVVASIPIDDAVESLNASVATGIALFEISRVRAQAAESGN